MNYPTAIIKISLYIVAFQILSCSPSPYDLSAFGDVHEIEKLVIRHPGLVNERDKLGKTITHYAVLGRNKSLLELLYLYGADLNSQDITGMTPLHVCAMWDLRASAKWLVDKGARIDLVDKYGDTPLHTSAVFGSVQVGKYLIIIGLSLEQKNYQNKSPLDLAKENGHLDWIQSILSKKR